MVRKILKPLHRTLLRQEKTLAVAESCTGGLLSSYLTRLPGASAYFICGVITYSNKAKISLLNIPAKTIAQHGAVSLTVAKLMAKNVRQKNKVDFGLSITGIAGPGKASTLKSVGTVFIALADKNKTLGQSFHFSGSRESIRHQAVKKALNLLAAQVQL